MKRLILTLTLVIFVFAAPFSTFADVELTLQWDTDPEPGIAGYRVYFRTEDSSYDYDTFEWQGSESQCTVPALEENTVYYFVLRAFNQEDIESADSNEVRYPPLNNSRSYVAGSSGCFIASMINP